MNRQIWHQLKKENRDFGVAVNRFDRALDGNKGYLYQVSNATLWFFNRRLQKPKIQNENHTRSVGIDGKGTEA